MALFSRSLKPGSDGGLPGANGEADAESAARHTIGELLRETRQSYGGDIDRIAATLRIRPSYLTAIELSQYDKLPGPVYAQGFVRAYAVHLGLDGDEAIRRFKQEIAGFGVSRDLSFPVPLAERSIPGGTMVLAALILAICGYGLWYYVSTSDRSHPERVSAVPPDLIAAAQKPALPPDAPAPALPEASTAAASPPPAATPASPLAAGAAPPASPAGAPSTASAAASPAMPATTPVAAPAAPVSPPAASPPSALLTTPPNAATAAPVPAETASAPAPAAPSAPATDSAATPPETQARVYGAPADAPARIIVHAIKDSWVQLRNGDEILVQRILHPGDSLRVPDESGLSLRTGNGAGLQLEIDGKLGKPLSGTVRTVALDADRLSASGGNVPRPE